MTPEEYQECLEDLVTIFGFPGETKEDREKILDRWWMTAQCKDGRCWREAVEMICEHREYKSFPQLGEFMKYYQSAVNAMKYDKEPRIPLSGDMEEVRRIDNQIFALSKADKYELRKAAYEEVVAERNEELKRYQDEFRPTVKEFINNKKPSGMMSAGMILTVSPQNLFFTIRVKQRMRELFIKRRLEK